MLKQKNKENIISHYKRQQSEKAIVKYSSFKRGAFVQKHIELKSKRSGQEIWNIVNYAAKTHIFSKQKPTLRVYLEIWSFLSFIF